MEHSGYNATYFNPSSDGFTDAVNSTVHSSGGVTLNRCFQVTHRVTIHLNCLNLREFVQATKHGQKRSHSLTLIAGSPLTVRFNSLRQPANRARLCCIGGHVWLVGWVGGKEVAGFKKKKILSRPQNLQTKAASLVNLHIMPVEFVVEGSQEREAPAIRKSRRASCPNGNMVCSRRY